MRPIRGLALAMLVVVAACQPASGGASPSGSAAASVPSPSSIASSAGLPFPAIQLPPESRVRLAQPLTAFLGPGEPPSRDLASGTEVVVVEGPRKQNGETWYTVDYPLTDGEQMLPWVRISDPASLVAITTTCPASRAGALSMVAWDRLTCLGGDPVTVVGQIGHCQGGVVMAQPEWLAYACWNLEGEGFDFDLHAIPASGITFPDDIVRARVTGHFDDPASATCRSTVDVGETWAMPLPAEQVLLCREAFVVDSMEILEVIGTPPAA